MIHHQRIRLQMVTEGITALQAGDNPWIINDRIRSTTLDKGEGDTPDRHRAYALADGLRRPQQRHC